MRIAILSRNARLYSTGRLIEAVTARGYAVRAAKTMGLTVCGVDILRSSHRPVVLEMNSSPGLDAIETATSKDIAGQIITFPEANVKKGKTRTRGEG